jgi:hypothetical protein
MEDYIDVSTDEKLLAWWEANCPERPDQSKEAGVRANPEMPCKKCEGKDRDQVFGGELPGGNVTLISKALAERIIEGSAKAPLIISKRLLDCLIYQNEWEEQHVAHVSDVHTPGIIACGRLLVAGEQTLFCYLIDGTHRAVAARRAGRLFKAYILSFKETFECVVTPKKIAASQKLS